MEPNNQHQSDLEEAQEPLTEEEYLAKHKDVFNLMKMIMILSSVVITISVAQLLRFLIYGDLQAE